MSISVYVWMSFVRPTTWKCLHSCSQKNEIEVLSNYKGVPPLAIQGSIVLSYNRLVLHPQWGFSSGVYVL